MDKWATRIQPKILWVVLKRIILSYMYDSINKHIFLNEDNYKNIKTHRDLFLEFDPFTDENKSPIHLKHSLFRQKA
jgi:hypothetical protein